MEPDLVFLKWMMAGFIPSFAVAHPHLCGISLSTEAVTSLVASMLRLYLRKSPQTLRLKDILRLVVTPQHERPFAGSSVKDASNSTTTRSNERSARLRLAADHLFAGLTAPQRAGRRAFRLPQ